jgi:hypothetical protein
MIELSKCPNCSEDERVTIAGKEFCMRCGTPSEDNAMMGVNQAQPEANQGTDPAPVVDQSAVQKFSEVQTPPSQIENTSPASSIGEFVPPPRMEVAAMNSSPVNNAAEAPIAQNQPSISSPIPIVPVTPPPIQPPANVMPQVAAMGTMSLDKKQPGVLSDDQFDQLTASVNSAVAPTAQAPIVNNSTVTSVPDSSGKPGAELENKNIPITDPIGAQDLNNTHQQVSAEPVKSKLAMSTDIYSNDNKAPAAETHDQGKGTEPKKKSAAKVAKPVAIAVSIAALFATGAYIWKVNYPSLAFKIASAKAGISATMPGYVPAGYNLGGRIQTNPGTVSYSLLGNSNDNRISVTQTKTDWDSQALAENYVAPKAENYLALQAQGLTIYVMGKNEATWVNKGTWYKLDGKGQELNQDQIIKIATSL